MICLAEHTETHKDLLVYQDISSEKIYVTEAPSLSHSASPAAIASGNLYRHFKDCWYSIIALAKYKHETLVIYQAIYEDQKIYARDFGMFFEKVPPQKLNPTGQPYRFMSLQALGLNIHEIHYAAKSS